MSALRRILKVKGGYEVTVSCSNKPTLTAFYRTYEQCGKFADDYFFDYLGVQLKCAHHPVGDGVEPEGLNPDSLETMEIEIPMNERLKELAVQAGLDAKEIRDDESLTLYAFEEFDIERFAELVRQDEREACAKAMQPMLRDMISRGQAADIIRARSNHEQD
jgi:hypothetical protein